jgi:hypothetical protein
MKIAYLILAHNNPSHFKRLISSLQSGNCLIFVHVDRKSRLDDFLGEYGSSVKFLKRRFSVYRHDYSMVEATFALMRTALAELQQFDYLILLSGCDYPLHSNQYIERFLIHNRGKEFMNIVEIPNEDAGKPLSRLAEYKYKKETPFISTAFRKLLVRIGLISSQRDYRKFLEDLIPYGGSQWWCLSCEACRYIIGFVEEHPKLFRFFENTSTSDETVFHTILGNSEFKRNIHRSLMYMDWSEKKSSPAIITERHLAIFNQDGGLILEDHYGIGEALFARKFTDDSEVIVNRIDLMLRNKQVPFPNISNDYVGNV